MRVDLETIVRCQLRPTLFRRATSPFLWPWLGVAALFFGVMAVGLTLERGGLRMLPDPIVLAILTLALISWILRGLPESADKARRVAVGAWWCLIGVEGVAIAAALM